MPRVLAQGVCLDVSVVSKYVSCLVFQAHPPKITTHLHTTGIHRVGQRTSMKPTLSQTSSKRVCHAIDCPDNRPCCVCSFWGSVWAVLQARVLVACYRISVSISVVLSFIFAFFFLDVDALSEGLTTLFWSERRRSVRAQGGDIGCLSILPVERSQRGGWRTKTANML